MRFEVLLGHIMLIWFTLKSYHKSAIVREWVCLTVWLVCVQSEKYASWVNLTPQLDCSCRCEAEVRVLDFQTTLSEFNNPSQTDTEQGEAKLGILNFKTTWSEFQKPSQTAATRGKAELHILDFKTTCPVRLLLSEATLSYVYLILKPHGQSSRSPVILLLSKEKLSYAYSILMIQLGQWEGPPPL